MGHDANEVTMTDEKVKERALKHFSIYLDIASRIWDDEEMSGEEFDADLAIDIGLMLWRKSICSDSGKTILRDV